MTEKTKFYVIIKSMSDYLKGDYVFSIGLTTDESLPKWSSNATLLTEIELELPKLDSFYDKALSDLDRRESSIRATFENDLQEVETARQELLAIPHKPQETDL